MQGDNRINWIRKPEKGVGEQAVSFFYLFIGGKDISWEINKLFFVFFKMKCERLVVRFVWNSKEFVLNQVSFNWINVKNVFCKAFRNSNSVTWPYAGVWEL